MLWRISRGFAFVGMAGWIFASFQSGIVSAEGSPTKASAAPLKVLILSGGGAHDWRASALILRRILEDSGRFDVRICETPAGLTERTLADFDVLVDDYAGISPGNATENAIEHFVSSGKGLVMTHGALRFAPGGRKPRLIPPDGPAVHGADKAAHVRFLKVKVAQTNHPIVRGMAGEFRTADALPRDLKLFNRADVIANAIDDDSAGGAGDPVVITMSHGKGRLLYLALGCDAAAMHEKEFITAFARGTEWSASGAVTLPPDLGPPGPAPGAVKALLITGGHDHEAAFYTIFDDQKDLDWLPVATSADAFKSDLRGKYEVVIMYDFSRDLGDAGKKNLRDFVESGGGVVVLHHALLNYQKWTWWSEEVVGGRYRLERAGNIPSSTVKNDQQIFVTPVREHPVTAGIQPFHIMDEAYKNLWMSPKIRPLLSTDNPTSDTNLAWIGPGEKFRVVAIQLGHGHSAFGHPSYRALVHNAILWASKKTK